MIRQFMQRDLIATHGRIIALLLVALTPTRDIFQRRIFSFERLASDWETVGRKHIVKLFCHGVLFNE